jgi:purine-nucleoside phosphorylase
MKKVLCACLVILLATLLLGKDALADTTQKYLTTPQHYLNYLLKRKEIPEKAPETLIICYQKSSVNHILEKYPHQKEKKITLLDGGKIGLIGGIGYGSPCIIPKVDVFLAWGVKRVIAIGTAGSLDQNVSLGEFVLCTKALGEDGVSHLYLPKGHMFASASSTLISDWNVFMKKCHPEIAPFLPVTSWSFCHPFRETHEDLIRVKKIGCHVVEMEAAALYALGEETQVPMISLFVISDTLHNGTWDPNFREPLVENKLQQLCDWAIDYSHSITR